MKNKLRVVSCFILLSVVLLIATPTMQAGVAPPNMAAGLIIQFLGFEKNLISINDDLIIHVVGSSALADELKKSIGTKVSNRSLSKVTQSGSIPKEHVDVLVIADAKIVSDAIAYTRKEKIPSITNIPELVQEGVSLGIGMNETGGQSIVVNLTAAAEENLDWKPVILKIAKTVK